LQSLITGLEFPGVGTLIGAAFIATNP